MEVVGGGRLCEGNTLGGYFAWEQRHLSQGTHASAVRGSTPLGWLASQSRGRQRQRRPLVKTLTRRLRKLIDRT